jgi:hypothetical protein
MAWGCLTREERDAIVRLYIEGRSSVQIARMPEYAARGITSSDVLGLLQKKGVQARQKANQFYRPSAAPPLPDFGR